jgi:lipoprotein-releasing system ATP-binding protein
MELETSKLSYTYTAAAALAFPDIHIKSGQKALILGQSGVGKSTLLHLLGLLLQPTAGSLLYNGQAVQQLSATKKNIFRAQNLGIIFQKSHFVQSLNVAQNIKLACYLAQKKPDEVFLENTANTLNIRHLFDKKTYELSIGEQQRIGILRAMITQPSLLLADEPTSSLDDHSCAQVTQQLLQLSNQIGATLVIVTHDQRLKSSIDNHVILSSHEHI